MKIKNEMKCLQNNSEKIIPVKVYVDVYKDKMIIYKENKKKSGIYKWTNKINNKKYIGSSIDLTNRFTTYFSYSTIQKIVNKKSSLIYAALLKYGYSNFSLEILEYCEPNLLINREQYYLDTFNPEYNILKIAGSRSGCKLSYKSRKAISIALRGKKFNKCKLIDIFNTKNKNISPKNIRIETKNKLSLRSRGIKVKVFDLFENLMYEFPSINSAAKNMNISTGTIKRILNTGVSYDNYIYEFEVKDLRVLVLDNKYILTNILKNAEKTSEYYNIPRSTLSNYINSGKLYKDKYYFYSVNYKNINISNN